MRPSYRTAMGRILCQTYMSDIRRDPDRACEGFFNNPVCGPCTPPRLPTVGADPCVRPSVRYRTGAEISDRRRSACLYKASQIAMNPQGPFANGPPRWRNGRFTKRPYGRLSRGYCRGRISCDPAFSSLRRWAAWYVRHICLTYGGIPTGPARVFSTTPYAAPAHPSPAYCRGGPVCPPVGPIQGRRGGLGQAQERLSLQSLANRNETAGAVRERPSPVEKRALHEAPLQSSFKRIL